MIKCWVLFLSINGCWDYLPLYALRTHLILSRNVEFVATEQSEPTSITSFTVRRENDVEAHLQLGRTPAGRGDTSAQRTGRGTVSSSRRVVRRSGVRGGLRLPRHIDPIEQVQQHKKGCVDERLFCIVL